MLNLQWDKDIALQARFDDGFDNGLEQGENRLGVGAYWKCTVNPLQMTYLPTGQKILFKGLDDSLKITSITVEKGHLCWCWGEEFYEVRRCFHKRLSKV